MAQVAVAGIFILIVACGVGFGVASADSTDDLARAGAFGFDSDTHQATQGYLEAANTRSFAEDSLSEGSILSTASARDITAGLEMVNEREEAERVQVAADNKAVLNRVANQKAMQGVGPAAAPSGDDRAASSGDDQSAAPAAAPAAAEEQSPEAQDGASQEGLDEYKLTPVDWTVGKYAFIAEWSERIDAYLDGTVLEGYGTTFAEEAWRRGVDPRWSPAISNTESGNGAHCFLPHNAWGWGDRSWSDWESAIKEHVEGLALGYGYSVTFEAAQKYCPPNSVHWYNNTLGQMALI